MFDQVKTAANGDMVDWSDYLTCSQGREQSPINIETDAVVPVETEDSEKLEWESPISTLDLSRLAEEYDDNVFEIRNKDKPYMRVDGTTYHLTEIELHAPSENTIDGKHHDLEIQFRHTAPGPTYMIVSVMFVKGDAAPGIVDQMNDIIQRPTQTGPQAIAFDSILQSINSTALGR